MNRKMLSKEILHSLPIDQYADMAEEIGRINPADIDGDLMRHPAIFTHFAGVASEAKRLADRSLLNLSLYESSAKEDERRNRIEKGIKITDKSIENWVITQPKYRELQSELLESNARYEKIKAIVRGLEHKRDCLVQLSSNNRAISKIHG